MTGASTPPGPPQGRLRRAVDGAWVAGVCAGLAEQLGVSVRWVRVVVVILSVLFSGLGVVLYLALWALTPQLQHAPTVGPGPRRGRRVDQVRAVLDDEASTTIGIGIVLVAAALTLLLGGSVTHLGVVVPLVLVAVGAVMTWSQLDRAQRAGWAGALGGADGWRIAVGAALAMVGLVVLGSQGRGIAGLADAAFSGVLVLAGVVVIAAPWALRGWEDLRREQVERARATERADIAAHLHDSVLQTLALVQRRADDPVEVARLARAQERELRAWLYGGTPSSEQTLAGECAGVVHALEDTHGVPVDLVVTGDAALDDDTRAFTRALGEAVSNAVRHGAPPVSVYVEIGRDRAEAFVRDHGAGFDPDAVPDDRAGVRHSIIGRMARHSGTACVRRLEEGTEVSLSVPVAPAHPATAAGTPAAAPVGTAVSRPDPTTPVPPPEEQS